MLFFAGKKKKAFPSRIVLPLFLAVVVLLIISAYSNSVYAPFVLDDLHSFVKESKVTGFTCSFAGVEALSGTRFGRSRFLPMLTFALDYQWGHGGPFAYHVTNVFIHILALMSLVFFLRVLLSLPAVAGFFAPGKKGAVLFIVAVAGIWALNPVQTNAVTYIVQRMASMAALFYFLALGCYFKGRLCHLDNGMSVRTVLYYALAAIIFLCSMLSKENSATLPLVVLLAEWLFIDNSGLIAGLRKHWRWLLAVIVLAATIVIYKMSQGWLLDGYANRHFTLTQRLLTELRVVGSYCFLLILPLPRFLNLEHDVPLSTSLFSPATTLLALVFIVALLVWAFRSRKRNPLVTFGILWFFVNLLIESTVIPLELKFEHRLYLPSFGFYLALFAWMKSFYVTCWSELSAEGYKILASIILVACSGLSLATYVRNTVWRDTITLYSDCVAKAPNKARSHSNLATALLKQGQYAKGLREGKKALELGIPGYEEYWVAACDVVTALAKMGKFEDAVTTGEELLQNAPQKAKKNSYPVFLYDLGMSYLAKEDFQKALDYFIEGYKISYRNNLPEKRSFEQTLAGTIKVGLLKKYQFDPKLAINLDRSRDVNAVAAGKMAHICYTLGDLAAALKYANRAVEFDDHFQEALNLEKVIRKSLALNESQKARGTFTENYLRHPFASRFNFYMALAITIEKSGLPVGGFLDYCLQQAKKYSEPGAVDYYLVRSWYYYKKNDYENALRVINRGIEIDQDYARAWVNKGIYALAARKPAVAAAAFKRSLLLYPGNANRGKIEVLLREAEKKVVNIKARKVA